MEKAGRAVATNVRDLLPDLNATHVRSDDARPVSGLDPAAVASFRWPVTGGSLDAVFSRVETKSVGERSDMVGEFVWNTTLDRWQWDDGMYQLHGYRAGVMTPTTALVLEHKQDEHKEVAARLLSASASEDRQFSNYHGIVDVSGRSRTVLTVGRSSVEHSRDGAPLRLARGYMIDVTAEQFDLTSRAVERIRESTAPIQESVGLLKGSLGLTEQQALAVLRRMSSQHNVKLRDVARRFMESAVATAPDGHRDLAQLLLDATTQLAQEQRPTGQPKLTKP